VGVYELCPHIINNRGENIKKDRHNDPCNAAASWQSLRLFLHPYGRLFLRGVSPTSPLIISITIIIIIIIIAIAIASHQFVMHFYCSFINLIIRLHYKTLCRRRCLGRCLSRRRGRQEINAALTFIARMQIN